MEPERDSQRLRFGAFEADLRSGELRREGRKVALQEKPFQVLALLIERPGEVVTREELQQRIWPSDVFVDFEQGLNTAIKKVRLALDDSAENPRFVETLAKRGYRFISPVSTASVAGMPVTESKSRPSWVGWRVALFLLLALGVALAIVRFWPPHSVSAGRSKLLVLPFQNMSGDAGEEYFSDGMTEEMIVQVGRLKPDRLAVIGRTSSMHYKGTAPRADEIGRELGVEYLLSGSVRRSGRQVRVTVALVRTADQVQLWTETYDRDLEDVLQVQTAVATAVAGAIPLVLSADDRARLAAAAPLDPAVHEAYLQGLYFWNKFDPRATPKAIERFQQAIDRDRGFALAHAGLASAYTQSAVLGIASPREAYPKAKAAAVEALGIAPNLSEAHNPLGWAALLYDWDFPAAERDFTRGIALDPNSAEAYHGYGMYQAAMGRMEAGLATMRHARELDPLSLHINHKLCAILYWSRQYDAAIGQCRRTLELDSRYSPAHWHLAHALDAKGLHDEAQEEYFLADQYMTGDAERVRQSRAAAKASGWKPFLRQSVEGWSAALKSANDPQEAAAVADIVAEQWARLGEKERALEWLERSADARDFFAPFIGVEPLYDPLRSDPRFQKLLRRIGLPEAGGPRT
jgi:TolB-like protein/DNA-binding winged helix-turn-helix (wHTH) protein/Tfp pilus assembly protein PilF